MNCPSSWSGFEDIWPTFQQMASACGGNDFTVAFKNGPDNGGYAMEIPLCVIEAPNIPQITTHELAGHLVGELMDEYTYDYEYDFKTMGPNCDTDSSCPKWDDVPGMQCLQGCSNPPFYRPGDNCMMTSVRNEFCPVCQKYIKETILPRYK